MLSTHPGDSQKVELLGRNRFIDELLRDNLDSYTTEIVIFHGCPVE